MTDKLIEHINADRKLDTTAARDRRESRIIEYEDRILADAEVIKAAVALADAALHYQRADFELVISASDKLTEKRAAFHRAMQGREEPPHTNQEVVGPDDPELLEILHGQS